MRLSILALTCASSLALLSDNAGRLYSLGGGHHRRELSEIGNKHIVEKILQKKAKRAKRDASDGDYSTVDHNDLTDGDIYAGEFRHQEDICMLQPEADVGPYFIKQSWEDDRLYDDNPWVEDDMEMGLVLEIYNVETCEPIEDARVQYWACNSQGDYSGIYSADNANGADLRNETFNRRFSEPSEDTGLCEIDATFPGFTSDRTTHFSYAVHLNVELDEDDNFLSSTIVHVGEAYFDQELIDNVSSIYPYNRNTHSMVKNVDDNQLKLMEGLDAPDPFLKYYGGDIEDIYESSYGFYAWMAIGVNASASYDPQPVAEYQTALTTFEYVGTHLEYNARSESSYTTLDTTTQTIFSASELDYTYTTPTELTGSAEIPKASINTSSRPYVHHESARSEDSYTPSYPTQYLVTAQPEETEASDVKDDEESAARTSSSVEDSGAAASSSSLADSSSSHYGPTPNASGSSSGANSAASGAASGVSSGASTSNGQSTTVPSVFALIASLAFVCVV